METIKHKPKIPMTRPQIVNILRQYPELREMVLGMLQDKAPKEVFVLRHVYFQDGIKIETLTDIARMMGITRSRVQQLRKRGLLLLSHAQRKHVIEKYIITNMMRNGDHKSNQKILQETTED